MPRWGWAVVALLLCPGPWACAGEKPKAPSEQEIKDLIAKLVSPNPKPTLRGDGFVLPKGYDCDKQEKVHEAREKLRQIGPKAFPLLIEQWDDDRYCLTICVSGASNESVGWICRSILFDQILPYGYWPNVKGDPRFSPRRPSYPGEFFASKKAAAKWWEKHKDKTLCQIQLEALDWVIAEEAKRPRDFTDEERQELKQTRKKLVKSGKPSPTLNHYGIQPTTDPPK